jgi:iron complex transport system substrate-binding protein
VSLAPSVTEIIYALGAGECLVGRSSACKNPAVVTNIVVAGDFGVPALEVIAQLQPTLVLTVDLAEKNSGAALERLGLRHVNLTCRTLDEIPPAIRTIGQLLHHRPAAERLAADFAGRLHELRRQPPPVRRPRVFLELWGDPLMTAGRRAFLSELIELAGGENIAGDVARDFFQISPEVVLARDPEVVVQLEPVPPNLSTRTGWAQIAAVQSNRICADLDRDLLQTPGPRVLDAVEELRRCFWGVRRLAAAGPATAAPRAVESGGPPTRPPPAP